MNIPLLPLVNSLPATTPFVGPETLERNTGKVFKARIGANESAFGMSELAAKAIAHEVSQQQCSWYADPENHVLREALAKKHGVDKDEICIDAGIDALLGLTVRLFIEPGQTVVTSDGAYPTFNYHVAGFGGQLHKIPYLNEHEDSEGLIDAAMKHKARLVYFSNPDNPMGTWRSADDVQAMINRLPEQSLLLLDEAYTEFSTQNTAPAIDTSNPFVLRYRTFSKAYGMAGMRIGYVIAHKDIISAFNKIRNHFAINRLSQVAALASLHDEQWLPHVLKEVAQGRELIYHFADNMQLRYLPSATNFVAVDLHNAERANQILAQLNDAGVFIRKPMAPGLDRFIRVGVGSAEEQRVFEEAFTHLWQTSS